MQWYVGGDDQVPEASQRLVITLLGTVNPDAVSTIPSNINFTLLPTSNITDASGCASFRQADWSLRS